MLPRHMTTLGTCGAEDRPVTVIEEDLQATLLGKLARLGVENDDPGLCGQDLQRVYQGAATTYDE